MMATRTPEQGLNVILRGAGGKPIARIVVLPGPYHLTSPGAQFSFSSRWITKLTCPQAKNALPAFRRQATMPAEKLNNYSH